MNENTNDEDNEEVEELTVAKLDTGGYRISLSFMHPTTGRQKTIHFTMKVNSNFKHASSWNVDIVLGAALRYFGSLQIWDIIRTTNRGLGNRLYHFLRKLSNRNQGKHILKKYESEGRKYRKTPRTIVKRSKAENDLPPSNSGVEEGCGKGEAGRGETIRVCQDVKERAIPIPKGKSVFSPEPSGVTYGIVGKSFSGKTTFIVNQLNALTQDELDKYNAFIFFTESAHADPLKDLAPRVTEKMILTDRFCPKILQALKKLQDATHIKFKFLVIFDDIIQLRGLLLTKSILTLRNSNISTAISIQYEKLLNPAQRSSIHNMFIFNLRTESWEYMLRGFILGNIKEMIPSLREEKSVCKVSQQLRQCMDDYILYYDQRKDHIEIWKKK